MTDSDELQRREFDRALHVRARQTATEILGLAQRHRIMQGIGTSAYDQATDKILAVLSWMREAVTGLPTPEPYDGPEGFTNYRDAYRDAKQRLMGYEWRMPPTDRPSPDVQDLLTFIRGFGELLADYHMALDRRDHGGVAAGRFIYEVETRLKMPWRQGKLLKEHSEHLECKLQRDKLLALVTEVLEGQDPHEGFDRLNWLRRARETVGGDYGR